MKRTVKSREELEKLFKEQGYTSCSDYAGKDGQTFNVSMFKYCGENLNFRAPDEDNRLYMKDNMFYFIEDWLVPLEPVQQSREWWKARLPFITAFANGEAVQNRGSAEPWTDCIHPNFDCDIDQYRLKPKTILVNGIEVEAPLTEAAPCGTMVYLASPGTRENYQAYSASVADWFYGRGLVHATKEGAIAHAKAMLGIKEGKENAE